MATHRKWAMRIAAGVAATVVAVPVALADAAWQPVQTLSETNPSEKPHLAMSADGSDLVAVWKSGGQITSSSSSDGGGTWTPAQSMGTAVEAGTEPQIVASRDAQTAIVAWEENDGTIASRTTTNGGVSWGTQHQVAPATSNAPRLTASADGQRVTAVWWGVHNGYDTVYAATSTDAGGSWGAGQILSAPSSDESQPQVVSSSDGMLLTAAWSHTGGGSVRASTSIDGGLNWGAPASLDQPGTAPRLNSLAAAADGTATAAWQANDGARNSIYTASRKAAESTWTSPVKMLGDQGGMLSQLVVSERGARMAAVWKTEFGSLLVSSSQRGGDAWSSPHLLSDDLDSDYGLATSAGGARLVAVWTELGSVVSATSNDAGATWSAPVQIATGSGYAKAPTVASSGNGGAGAVAWYRDVSGARSVEFSRAAIPVSDFQASPLSFGDQPVGEATTRTLTVTNSGTGPLVFSEVGVSGAPFAVDSQTCTTAPVAPGSTCAVQVRFFPDALGSHTGTVSFADNTDFGSDEVGLLGDGVNPAPTPTPTPTPSPTPPGPTRLEVTARKGTPIPLGKKTTLVSAVSADGSASVRVTCSPKKAQKSCGAKVKGVRVTAKPRCSKKLKITATITATKAGAQPATWTRTWKVKSKKPVTCKA